MEQTNNDNFNLDFSGSTSASDKEKEQSFVDFSLASPISHKSRTQDFEAESSIPSMPHRTAESAAAEIFELKELFEELAAEPVSSQDHTPVPSKLQKHDSETKKTKEPYHFAEYAEEPLDSDDLEISFMNWGHKRAAQPMPQKQQPAPQLPGNDDEIEIKFCDFRYSAEQKALKAKERQKKNIKSF